MTGWQVAEAALAIIGALVVLAWLGCFVSAVLDRAEDGTDAAMNQAIGVTKPPAPAASPQPAPGHHPRVLYTLRAWDNGAICAWDGNRKLILEHLPGRDSDWDDALERLTRDLSN